MNSLNTIQNRILMAKLYENAITVDSNTYIGIGRPLEWNNIDAPIPIPYQTTESIYDVYRHLVSVKRILGSDTNLVVPRVDWSNNTVYSEYTEHLSLYTYETENQLAGNVTVTTTSLNVVGNGTAFTSNLAPGDLITIPGDGINALKVRKEVVSITNNQFMMVNSAFTNSYSQNNIYKFTNSYPHYANDFYVRNTYDQVFKCLLNNNGAESTVMPEIDIGGSLPENPFILTSDGYKWKYMYTIPVGLKEKFFTAEWMPVIDDVIVSGAAVDGGISIIKVISGGSGYLATGNSTSANIISISGDGTGANVTANVTSGVIDKVNIIDGGSGYKTATIIINDDSKTPSTNSANLIAVISPQGGHGFDVESELGATHLMICAELDGNELGKFPTENDTEKFDYRQISIIKDVLDSDGIPADNKAYNATYVVEVVDPAPKTFKLDEYVYQGASFAQATFKGIVSFWNKSTRELWLNNTTGTVVVGQTMKSTLDGEIDSYTSQVTDPEIELYSGEVLYVKNSEPIVRDNDQTEQIKIVISF